MGSDHLEDIKKFKDDFEENMVARRLVCRLTSDKTGEVGMIENTTKQQNCTLSEGEFITGVVLYHAQQLMKKNLLKELISLTMSFKTNRVRIRGPIDNPPAPHSLGLQIAEQNKQRLDSNQGNKGKMFFQNHFIKHN